MPQASKLPSPWLDLANRFGGPTAFARYLGVSFSTLYRWANGIIEPLDDNRARLDLMFASYNLPQPAYRTLRPK